MHESQNNRKEFWLIATVALLVSAVANGYLNDDFSDFITIIFSIAGSVALLVTILLYSKNAK